MQVTTALDLQLQANNTQPKQATTHLKAVCLRSLVKQALIILIQNKVLALLALLETIAPTLQRLSKLLAQKETTVPRVLSSLFLVLQEPL